MLVSIIISIDHRRDSRQGTTRFFRDLNLRIEPNIEKYADLYENSFIIHIIIFRDAKF